MYKYHTIASTIRSVNLVCPRKSRGVKIAHSYNKTTLRTWATVALGVWPIVRSLAVSRQKIVHESAINSQHIAKDIIDLLMHEYAQSI